MKPMYILKGRNGKVLSRHASFTAAKAEQLKQASVNGRLDLRIARGTK